MLRRRNARWKECSRCVPSHSSLACASRQYLSGFLTSNPGMLDELLDSLLLDKLPTREALDEALFELCRGAGASVAVAFAGGYAARNDDTVEIHCGTVREAARHTR